MMKEVTFDDLWEDLKQEDSEIQEKLEIAEKLSSIIEQLVFIRFGTFANEKARFQNRA